MRNLARSRRDVSVLPFAAFAADEKKDPAKERTDQVSRSNARTPVLYDKDIEPILVNKCIFCHSGNIKEGKLDMGTYEALDEGRQARGGRRARQVGREPAHQAGQQDAEEHSCRPRARSR